MIFRISFSHHDEIYSEEINRLEIYEIVKELRTHFPRAGVCVQATDDDHWEDWVVGDLGRLKPLDQRIEDVVDVEFQEYK